jgi:hypothetical protein
MEVLFCDLDGTLSKYPGSDFRSLYSKMIDFGKSDSLKPDSIKSDNEILIQYNVEAARKSAELMVNRYTEVEIEILYNNVQFLYQKFGMLRLLSLNFKIVNIEYLKELQMLSMFDIDNSFFRDDMKDDPHKEDVWGKILYKYPKGIIFIDDDITIINKLKKISPDNQVKFIHATKWLGELNIKDYL